PPPPPPFPYTTLFRSARCAAPASRQLPRAGLRQDRRRRSRTGSLPRPRCGALSVSVSLKRLAIGRPRATRELSDTLLPKFLALPIFSSDPISSVAYATEAALGVLVATSLTARHLVLPISVAIAALLSVVVVSYMQ